MNKLLRWFSGVLWVGFVLPGPAGIFAEASDPVGYFTVVVPPNSDGILSPALHRTPDFRGKIRAIVDEDTIVVNTERFEEDQFADTHYALIADGDREGLWAVVTANQSDRLELTFVNQDLGEAGGDRVEAGDSVSVIPFWTPATLIPESAASAQTELLVFSREVPGTRLSAVEVYRYSPEVGWHYGPETANRQPIYPDESILLRNNSDVSLSLRHIGRVPMSAFRTVLSAVAEGEPQDYRLATGLPVSIPLRDLVDPGAAGVGDQILIFNHDAVGQNKEASLTATYDEEAGWVDGETNLNDFVLQKGRGFVYRKAATNTEDIVIRHKPAYQE